MHKWGKQWNEKNFTQNFTDLRGLISENQLIKTNDCRCNKRKIPIEKINYIQKLLLNALLLPAACCQAVALIFYKTFIHISEIHGKKNLIKF